jgi:transcriptional regulator of acetoin/glycerol metabolism
MMIEFKPIQDVIMEEWNKSLQDGLNPYIRYPDICLNKSDLEKQLKYDDELISIFTECTYELSNINCYNDYLFTLANKDLFLIAIANYSANKKELKEKNLNVGISCSNKSIGVNAVSLSAQKDQPVYLNRNQHFCIFMRSFYSCAIPLKISGSSVAYLNILTTNQDASIKFRYLIDILSCTMMNKLHLSQCRKYKNMLSTIQLEILTMLANGNTEYEIAETLNYSTQSVKYHKHEIYKKFNVKNTADAITKLYRYNETKCSYT